MKKDIQAEDISARTTSELLHKTAPALFISFIKQRHEETRFFMLGRQKSLDQFCNLTTSIGEEFMIFLGEQVPPRHPGLQIEKANVMSRHGASINLQLSKKKKIYSM